MSDTANLKLPLLAAAQAQKHVTVNEALARIDAVLQLNVVSRTVATPPSLAEEGQSYLVPSGAVNDWSGRDGNLAFFLNGGWDFILPQTGWKIFVTDEASHVVFDGSGWVLNPLAFSAAGAAMRAEIIEFDHVIGGGALQEDTSVVIPAQSSVFGITGRVLGAVTGGLSDWMLGVPGSEDRYGSGLGLSAGSWLRGLSGQPLTYYSDTPLRLTGNGGSFASGTVRFSIHMLQFELPNAG